MGLIYLDSCILIYAIERDPIFGELVLQAIENKPESRFAISSLVKLECLVKPFRSGDLVLQRRYETAFEQAQELPIFDSMFVSAARLRARFGLRTPDALHLACAQQHNCDSLWTNDERLSSAAHGLALNLLA